MMRYSRVMTSLGVLLLGVCGVAVALEFIFTYTEF